MGDDRRALVEIPGSEVGVVAVERGRIERRPPIVGANQLETLRLIANEEPQPIRQWFQKLMQPDNPVVSCCGEADAFEADTFEVQGDHYVAIITDGKGTIPNGTRIPVPNRKMKWDEGNPSGHGIIFIGSTGQVYCYVTPGGV